MTGQAQSTHGVRSTNAQADGGFRCIAEGGFNTKFNVYVWSLKAFGAYLYAGTLNRMAGCQIWRYDGNIWRPVVRLGFFNPRNEGIRNLMPFKGHLYAGTYNQAHGGQIWRTADGVRWNVVVENGLGNPNNIGVRGMAIFQDALWVGVQTNTRHLKSDGDSRSVGMLWRTTDGTNWEAVVHDRFGDRYNESVHKVQVFRGYLYMSTRNKESGAQVWRTADGNHFEPIVGPRGPNPGGFGTKKNNVVYDLTEFQGHLYAGTGNMEDGFTVHRSADGVNFRPVGEPGFGDRTNTFAWRMVTFQDSLWLGVMNQFKGGGVWRTLDGVQWEEMVGPNGRYFGGGFGHRPNWGIRSMEEYNSKLYFGTAQAFFPRWMAFMTGGQVWEWSGGGGAST